MDLPLDVRVTGCPELRSYQGRLWSSVTNPIER